MLWVTLLATAAVALAEVEIITSPTPGNEFVKISGSPQDSANLTDPKVLVKNEGLSGVQHKYQNKKVDHHPLKKDTLGIKATVKEEGLSGVVKKHSGNNVPALKHMDEPKYEVLSRKNKWADGGLDFDDDLPLSDKKLKPAGSSQSSRINVKKGPNGQEYEYEYVYYYYDEDEDDSTTTSPSSPAPAPGRAQYSETPRRGVTEVPEEPRPSTRGELVKQKNVESGQEPPRSRGESPEHVRGGHHVVEVTEHIDEDLHRGRTESRTEDRSRNRYTTIERGASGGRGRGEAVATTVEPSANEVLPSRGSQRSRGRQVEAAPQPAIEDERLPANTRFPSRARGSSVATTIPPQTSQPAHTQTSRSRTQGGGATIRRPSLVDSSSFRTHASDSAPDTAYDKNYYRASVLENTRESDLEEYIQPELIRPTTFVPPQTTTPPPPAPLPVQPQPVELTNKAALDLYAILQQQQEENSVSGSGGEVDTYAPTELVTTPEPTTVTTTTTTTTTTTEAPTTTTTQPPPPTGRSRFRGAPGARARVRPGGSTTTSTTTTEAPQEEEAPRRKFQPSHGGRQPGLVSAYGRRGSGARASTTTSAPTQEQEASTARARASFGGNRNSFRSRGRTTAAPSSQDDDSTPETTSASTPAPRPTRPRLNVSAATRPLRPGPRINLRGRGGISTTTAAPPPPEEEPSPVPSTNPPSPAPEEESSSPTPAPPSDVLSRLRNRPRLKVSARVPGAAQSPAIPASRPAPQGFRRPVRPLSLQATPAAEEPSQAPTEPAPPQTEAPPPSEAPTEPQLPPHLQRRRPAIRRLQIPHRDSQ